MAKSNLNGYTRGRGEFLLSHSKWTGRYFKSSEDIKKHDPGKDWELTISDRWQYKWGGKNIIFYALWAPLLHRGPGLFQAVINGGGVDMVAHLLEHSGKEGETPQEVIDNNFCEEMFVPLHTQEAQEIYEDEELEAYFEELKPEKKPRPKGKKIVNSIPEGWFLASKVPPPAYNQLIFSEYTDGSEPVEVEFQDDRRDPSNSKLDLGAGWVDTIHRYPLIDDPYIWKYAEEPKIPLLPVRETQQLIPSPSTPILVSATGTIELINKNSSQILNLKPDVKIKN